MKFDLFLCGSNKREIRRGLNSSARYRENHGGPNASEVHDRVASLWSDRQPNHGGKFDSSLVFVFHHTGPNHSEINLDDQNQY
jgi:hypothetical protein